MIGYFSDFGYLPFLETANHYRREGCGSHVAEGIDVMWNIEVRFDAVNLRDPIGKGLSAK